MKKYVLLCIAILQGLPSMALSQKNDSIPLRSLESQYTINKNLPVGTIDGVADVSSSGAATYTVPIEIAHGEYGYWPSLQLVYNSQSGDGILGIGWNLSGVSAISRCGKSHYYDGCAEEVHMSSNDNLLLDGKRLLLVSGNNLTEGAVYNLESDPTTKVVYHTVGSYLGFTVHLKDGSTIEYGLSANSRLTQGNTAWLWKQNKSTDLRGRTITYTYEINNTTNESYLTKISYDTNRYVRFTYGQRPQASLVYYAGICVQTTKRLEKIASYARGSLIGEYRLTYSQDSPYSKLTDITFFGPDGSSHYNPTHVTYGGESYRNETIASYSEGKNGQRIHYGDLNGDGRMDFVSVPLFGNSDHYSIHDYLSVYLSRYNNGVLSFEKVDSLQLGGVYDVGLQDFDGNGVCDIYTSMPDDTYQQTQIKYYALQNNILNQKGNFCIGRGAFFLGDFDGDGRTEVLNYNRNLYDISGNVIATSVNINWDDQIKKKEFIPSTKFICDFNGNGKEDIIVVGNSNLKIYEFSGSVIDEVTSFRDNRITRNNSLSCGDFNGDGYTDIISHRRINSSNYEATLFLSTGSSLVSTSVFNVSEPVRIGDFNNDGKSDIFYRSVVNNSTQYSIGISSGTSFEISNVIASLVNPTDFEGAFWVENLSTVADFDGDGKTEFGFFRKSYGAIITKFDDNQNLLVTNITDGLGKMVSFDYRTTSDTSVCTINPSEYSYPVAGLGYPIRVVSLMEVKDEYDSFQTTYNYKKPRIHIRGKGFLGFKEMTITDWASETKTTSTYSYSTAYYYPFLSKKVICTLSGDSITDETFQMTFTSRSSVHAKAFIPYLSKHIEYDPLKGRSTQTIQTIDSYGNVINSNTSYSGGFYKKITNTYNNITDGVWLIGQPSTTKTVNVTSSSSWTERQTYEYNSSYYPQKIISYTGNGYLKVSEETFSYDTYGNVTEYTVKPFSSANTLTTTYQYVSDYVDLGSVTDPLSLSTTYNYDWRGRLIKTTQPTGKTITKTYDGLGRIVQEATNDSVIVTTSWNWGTSSSGPLYSQMVSGNDGSVLKKWYDAFGREVRYSTLCYDSTYLKVDKKYDDAGRLQRVSLPYKTGSASKWNTFTYDDFGRVVREQYASGKVVDYAYSGDSITTTADGIPVTQIYNQRGELIKVTDPKGDVVYSYRADGQLENVTSLGIQISFSYNIYGRQDSINDPSAGTRSFSYNSEGRLSSETDADGRSVNYIYDSYGRTVQKVRPEMTTTYTYDNKSRLVGVSSDNGTGEEFTYDSFGRQASHKTIMPDGKFVKRDYTYRLGNITSVDYSNQSMQLGRESFTYSHGNLTSINFGNAQVWQLQAENNMGQCTTVGSGSLRHLYTFDDYGVPTGIKMQRGNTMLMNSDYSNNCTTGNLSWRKDNLRNITESFSYDNMNRLSSYGGNTMTYDDKGNILTKSDASLVLGYEHSTKPYAVTSIAAGFSPAAVRYSEQHISYNSFECPDTIVDNGNTVTFVYNANGERVVMRNGRPDRPTRYYAGNFYEEEGNADAVTYRLYLGGDAYSAPAVYVATGSGGAVYYIGRDHLGSITHITDNSGNLLHEYSYDPWGCLRNPATQERYAVDEEPVLFLGRGYCGHEHLQDLGLINMNARLYDPVLGRFLNPDPFVQEPGNSQNFNRYSYCLNNPLKYSDRNGKFFIELALVLAGAYIGGAVANDWQMNPFKWNYNSFNTYLGMGLGGLFGYVGGYGLANPGTVTFAGSLETPYFSLKGSLYSTGMSSGWKFSYGWITVAGGAWYSYDKIIQKNSNDIISKLRQDYYDYENGKEGYSSTVNDGIIAPITDETYWELVGKEAKEIEGILSKTRKENEGIVYELRTKESGYYKDVRLGKVYLEKGDVWKIGQTIHKDSRYKEGSYEKENFDMFPMYKGSKTFLLIVEKVFLYNYYIQHGNLPPGNKKFF